ncbi:spondin domain-containing protein [Thalassotalea fusca]
MKRLNSLTLVATLLSSLAIGGCSDNDTPSVAMPDPITPMPVVNYRYQVTVVNLTHAQPMSPIATLLHNEANVWEVGMPASASLEQLAESGNNTELLAEGFVLAGQSGEGILMPGASETLEVSTSNTPPQLLSTVTMLVNTNDAFSGFNAMDISNMAVGESISLRTGSYDAGTEKNSESSATIPGPASGGSGEGYNEARDDVDFVAMHPGVVTADDGLASSVLTQAHRFDNPTLAITVTRIE